MKTREEMTEEVEKAAGTWLARRDRGLSAGEERELAEWLQKSQARRDAFRELERAMAFASRLRELAPPGKRTADAIRSHRGPVRRSLPLALSVLAACVAFTLLVRREDSGANSRFETDAGGYQRVTLSDGSVMELNGGSSSRIAFTKAERRVVVSRGEGHFQVAKHPDRPFVVDASGVEVVAVGTAFSVKLAESDLVDVLVTEGRVQVRHPTGTKTPLTLSAGEKTSVAVRETERTSTVVQMDSIEVARALAWQPKNLDLARTPLGAVAEEFNRVGRGARIVVDPQLRDLKVGGALRADQVDVFLRLLEQGFDVVVERTPEEIRVRSSP